MAIVGLAGIASVLWTSVAGRLLDDPAIDGLLVAVWAFIGGAIYGLAVYFAVGAALYQIQCLTAALVICHHDNRGGEVRFDVVVKTVPFLR